MFFGLVIYLNCMTELKKFCLEAYKRYVYIIKQIEIEIKNTKFKNEKEIRDFLFRNVKLKKLKKS